jgi:LPXTG-motif cell wall-anchored protein
MIRLPTKLLRCAATRQTLNWLLSTAARHKLRLTLDFGPGLQQGPATMLITIDTADCLGRSSGGPDIGPGLFSDFRLPEVAEELPDTGPSNVAPLVAFATLMISAGAGMITRSRRAIRS